MADNHAENGERRRLLLLVPIATVITAIWAVCALRAAIYGDTRALVIATAPFTILCGFLFGLRIPGGGK